MLERQEVDVNIGSQTLRHDRSLVNDLSPQLLITGLSVFFKSSDAYELNAWEMMAVYNMNAWILFIGLTFGSIGALILTYVIMGGRQKPLEESFVQGANAIGRSLILKSYDIAIKRSSTPKVISVVVGLLSVVMFAYLRAGMTRFLLSVVHLVYFCYDYFPQGLLSKLAVRHRNLKLHTMIDLLDNNVRLILPVGGNIHASFAKAPRNTLLGQLYEKNVLPYSDTTLVERSTTEAIKFVVENDNYAIVMFASTGQGSPYFPCGIAELDEDFRTIENSLGYPKNWEFTQIFNYKLLQMMDSGVIKKLWKK